MKYTNGLQSLAEGIEYTFNSLKNGKTFRCKHIGDDNLLLHNQSAMLEYKKSKFLKGVEDLELKIAYTDAGIYELSHSDILLIEILMDKVLGQEEVNRLFKI